MQAEINVITMDEFKPFAEAVAVAAYKRAE